MFGTFIVALFANKYSVEKTIDNFKIVLSMPKIFRENFRLNQAVVYRRKFLSETKILRPLVQACFLDIFKTPGEKKTKTQEQNKQNSRILFQILEISAIFVHIYKFLDQNQTYFLKKCPITQELSQKIYRINFSFFGEKLTRIFEFSA